MSKSNPLVGLIGYGDSDESDEEPSTPGGVEPALRASQPTVPGLAAQDAPSAGIHPAPIAHCPWSACYDEGSGFTYYWNQHTNAVTWEAPPEYLLALKLAQQQLNASGSAEVSAEEWQLYQQALAEKQNTQNKAKTSKPLRPVEKPTSTVKNGGKRKAGSDDETEKIELITSYHNSDSESNDETDSPVKSVSVPKPPKILKATPKRPKAKSVVEYGPSLPANQNYTVPIGPELPPGMVVESKPKSPVNEVEIVSDSKEKDKKTVKADNEDSQDESTLFKRLKDKAKLLQKLGGEIPTELQKMIQDESGSRTASPKIIDDNKDTKLDIDDLLEEIEKTELPKVKSKKIDMFGEEADSNISTPTSTPPRTEVKSLFPSSKTITEETVSLFPSAANIQENGIDPPKPDITEEKTEKKVTNVYLMDSSEPRENTNRKKLRIDNSVLPERKKTETPAYTTKYSQFIDGFSSERTGLGFKEDDEGDKPKNTISYGNGLTFTKGEVLNEDKKDEELDDLVDLVDAKLKYLNQVQPCAVAPVQEMMIQLQTLSVAFRSGELTASYFERWTRLAARSLGALEASAAPPGWTCSFQRSSGRYRYRRESDGLEQWEYPAAAHMDMDICTTPPPPEDLKDAPPLPSSPPAQPPAPPLPPRALSPGASSGAQHPAQHPARAATPPPPAWHDPPPPGCDDLPPLPPEPKKEIGDELLSFYSDIAELEKHSPAPTVANSPEHDTREKKEKEKEKEPSKTAKKKSKVKISSSIGLKHKTVSNMVAKWQQVADEIHSD